MADQVGRHGQIGQAEVGTLLPDGVHDAVTAVTPNDLHPYPRMLRDVGGKEAARQAGLQARRRGDAQLARAGVRVRGERLDLVDGVERLLGELDDAAALCRHDDSPPRASEKGHAEFTFQVADRA